MKPFTDEQMEAAIGKMLQYGVSLAALVVLCGGLLYLRSGAAKPSYSVFRPDPLSLRTLAGKLSGSSRFDGAGIIQLGMLLLIATPVLRVLFCIVGFFRQRDRLYTAISASVFLILLYSFFQGGK